MRKYKVLETKKFGFLNLIITLFTLMSAFSIFNLLNTSLDLNRSKISLEKEYSTLLKENNKLKENIIYYKSNKGIEELARKRLNFIKDNEIPVRYISN